jgi:hypothetical protein
MRLYSAAFCFRVSISAMVAVRCEGFLSIDIGRGSDFARLPPVSGRPRSRESAVLWAAEAGLDMFAEM